MQLEEVKKIAVIGPESTGKSTLSKQLATHYNTIWCPEYARAYLLENGTNYTYDDLLKIAIGQCTLEDALLTEAENNLYVIDTEMYVMKVWSEFVFGKCHPFIEEQLRLRRYDLYLLCNPDLPWVADELREYPDEGRRVELYNIYRALLQNQPTKWIDVKGDHKRRLELAVEAVDELLAKG
jgi:NadR type nicotinamide-nucleotide adenylyltransferase